MTDRSYEADEPREFTWAGVPMYRCPVEACSWSHEDRDAVIEHINETGHVGPDPEPHDVEIPPESAPTLSAKPPTPVGTDEGGTK